MLAAGAGVRYMGGMKLTEGSRRKAVKAAVAHYGGTLGMASALGVTQGQVQRWVSEGAMPARRALQVEDDTQGQIKARSLWGGA